MHLPYVGRRLRATANPPWTASRRRPCVAATILIGNEATLHWPHLGHRAARGRTRRRTKSCRGRRGAAESACFSQSRRGQCRGSGCGGPRSRGRPGRSPHGRRGGTRRGRFPASFSPGRRNSLARGYGRFFPAVCCGFCARRLAYAIELRPGSRSPDLLGRGSDHGDFSLSRRHVVLESAKEVTTAMAAVDFNRRRKPGSRRRGAALTPGSKGRESPRQSARASATSQNRPPALPSGWPRCR